MKVEFWLPTGGGGMPATMHGNKIYTAVTEWAEQHDVDTKYCMMGREGFKYFVKFPHPEDYLVFKMTFTKFPFKFNYDK